MNNLDSVELGIVCFHLIMLKSLRYLDTMLCGPLIFSIPFCCWNRLMQKAAGQPETSYCYWSAHQYYQTAAGQPRVPFHRGSRTGPLTTFQDLYL